MSVKGYKYGAPPPRKPGYSIEHDSWTIPLTRGVIALVDAADVPVLAQHNWYANLQPNAWYALRNIRFPDGRRSTVGMHNIIVGDVAEGMTVDHEKHRDLAERVIDNRRANLRVCTRRQNSQNQRPQARPDKASRFKGVSLRDGKWWAAIKVRGKIFNLGAFEAEELAALAYDAAARKHFGEFSLTNVDAGLLARTALQQ